MQSPSAEGLTRLHRAHLETVPFENLDIHLGVPIALGDAAIDKIVDRGRGGFCYELNGAFAALLDALGYTVHLLEARVLRADGTPGIRFDHLCLLVEVDGDRFLADVGFGAFFTEPLRWAPGVDQPDPAGTYRIEDRNDGWFDLLADGAAGYRFELTPRALADFEPGCTYHQSPASHFSNGTVCSLLTERGRVTLSGLTLIETNEGERTESTVAPNDLRGVLADRFGVRLTEDEAARLAARPSPGPGSRPGRARGRGRDAP